MDKPKKKKPTLKKPKPVEIPKMEQKPIEEADTVKELRDRLAKRRKKR